MKKTFTLLAAMLLSVVMYAFPNPSKLSISSTDNSDIRVIVDGNKYRSNNNEVIVNNLTGGYHAIRVYQLKNGGSGSYYGYQKNNYRLVYNNSVYIKPQYYVDITINRFGKAYVDEQLITGGFEDEGDDWDDNNNPAGNNVIHAMNPVSFDQFKQSLKRESFDDTRQNLAKQGIAVNYFTATQVSELVNLFTFESNKLEIAKYAYTYTVDKSNYFMVSDAFTFSSSKDELAKYIQKFK